MEKETIVIGNINNLKYLMQKILIIKVIRNKSI